MRHVLVALVFGVSVASAGVALAQTTPPPATPPGATAPATPVAPPPAQTAPPPAGAPATAPVGAPGLEAGDSAPPGAASVETLDPMHSPPLSPAQTAPGVTSPLVSPVPPARRSVPFYRKDWFWGAVAVVIITGVIVTVLTVGTGDPATPNTKLGDMRAF